MNRETIEAPGVRLRLFRDADLEDLMVGCNDPLTRRFLPHLPGPYTAADAHWWISDGTAAVWARGGAAYAIADPATDRLLGGIGIDQVAPARGQGEIGYWVTPRARGRGVATAATTLLAGRALTHGFARLELLTDPENVASQRVALGSGFSREGIRRGAGNAPDGSRHDLVAWARLADDPPGPAARLLPDLPGGLLTDGVVTLRPLTAADTEFVHRLRSLPEMVATSVPPVAPERAEVADRCARAPGQWLAGERADLVILDTATGTPAGEIGLYYQEPQTGQAMIGYGMGPEWRGRGYPTRAARLVARWAFEDAGIERLIAGAAPDNPGSRRVLEKAGFRQEGELRGRLPGPAGRRLDDVLYGMLPQDLRR
ncbi:GNAT family N-acetyltransferase [Micromonospora sp. NBC_01796]|uniref:GNAT family N-acetyltransferase n=1 Tax=Micromonospora sp. NBC_01796 TaxID=2975987 RepID=UPI002DDBB305|nr:GNAT family N-acetyltransferase [Micromonospora sp. NBC_01796]WSA87520.1 GNAT family N-acetyltransferase [Micromonospora sp. NBC_01796]